MRKFTYNHLAELGEKLSFVDSISALGFDSLTAGFSLLDDSVMGPIEIVFGAKPPMPLRQAFFGTEGNDVFDASDLATNDSYDARGGNDIVGFGMNAFNVGLTVTLDGGTGIDHLQIATSYRNYGGDTLDGDNDFGGVVDITNNVVGGYGNLTISNFERLTIEGGGFGDLFRGGSGRDEIRDGGFAVTVDGNGSQDYGLGGNDEIYGMGGHDLITGTGGQDILDGGAGNDVIESGGSYRRGYYDAVGDNSYETVVISHATMIGGEGNDNIKSNGDDTLEGGAGDDALINERGSAVAVYSSADAADYEIIRTGTGIYTVEAIGGTGEGFDTLNGIETIRLGGINGTDYDITELEVPGGTIFGTSGDDVLTGTFFNDTIDGLAGDDTLNGGDGNDTLIGGAGRDRLLGDGGDDTLFFTHDDIVANGGAGDDILSYTGADYSGSVRLDGSVGTDTLYLESAYTGSGLANFDFRGSTISRIEIIELRAEASGADYDPIWLQMNWDQLAEVEQILAFAADDIFIYADAADIIDLTNFEVIGFGGQLYIAGSDTIIVDNANVSWQGASGDSSFTALYDELSDWNFTANGGAGFDVVDFSGMSDIYNLQQIGNFIGLLTVDLSDGSVALTQTNLGNSTDATASLTSIEHIIGWEGENRLSGSASAEHLEGNRARDTFEGRGGDDVLNGLGSIDTAIYSSANPGDYFFTETAIGEFTVEAIGGTGEGTDTLIGIENIRLGGVDGTTFDIASFVTVGLSIEGTAGDDILNGTATSNTINGLAGNDRLRGYEGDDILIGGEGIDVATFSSSRVADYIVTEIAAGEYTVESVGGTGEGTDTLTGIETLRLGNTEYDIAALAMLNIDLTDADDTYTANDSEVVHGLDGNDTLYAGGRDITLNGDAGNDTLFDITLTGQRNTLNGGAGADSLRIETYGSMANGDDGDDYIELAVRGYAANGGAGNDIIAATRSFGLYFNASVDGGSGNDTLVFRYDDSNDMDNDNRFGGTLNMSSGTSSSDYRLTTSGFESLDFVGGGKTDRVTGTDGDDIINDGGFYSFTGGTSYYGYGNGGDDFLYGMGGDDTLIGTGGTDVLDGGDGNDVITSGADYVSGYDDPIMDIYFAETLDSAAVMLGGAGDDILNSYGNDILEGGIGDDILINHEDGAVAVYSSANAADYIIIETAPGEYTVQAVGGIGEGTDTLTGIETIRLGGQNGTDYDISTLAFSGNIDLTNGDDIYSGTSADEFINALDGNDIIDGGAGNNTLNGDAGNDRLISLGNDILNGGAGNDTIEMGGNVFDAATATDGGADIDTISFSTLSQLPSGNLFLVIDLQGQAFSVRDGSTVLYVDPFTNFENATGSEFADLLQGDAGNNVLMGLGGDDNLQGRDGDDIIDGGAGDDTLMGGEGADVLNGGIGIDTVSYADVIGALTVDLLNGTASGMAAGDSFLSIENLIGGVSSNILNGDNLDNIITGGDVIDTLRGRGGDDIITGAAGNDYISGGRGEDTLFGDDGNDEVNGDDGNDVIYGGGGNDLLRGGEGNNTVYGGEGFDQLYGGTGEDTLFGGGGNDYISSGVGDDLLMGGQGDDEIHGSSGIDTAIYSSANRADYQVTQISGGYMVTALNGATDGVDTLTSVETIRLGGINGTDYAISSLVSGGPINLTNGDDIYSGTADDEVINALAGDDIIDGGAGNNTLNGDGGNDTLISLGNDVLNGGAGDDLIEMGGNVFDTATSTDGGDDIDTLSFSTLAQLPSGNLFLVIDLNGEAYSVRDGSTILYVDQFTNFENATGSAFGDLLQGDASVNLLMGLGGDDNLQGRDGNDTIDGGAGADILNGGGGIDIASYASALAGVTAIMGDASLNTGDAAGDSYIDIENITGSDFDDVLGGDANANIIDGGAGFDIASYAGSSAAIVFDGLGLIANSGDITADTLVNIEAIGGTNFDDRFYGDNGSSVFYGGEGNDRLFGRNGDDALYGEGGDDIILAGRDNDLIDGGAGNDQLRGNEGDDTIFGGDGNDSITGGAGADAMDGGAGIDRVEYTYGTNAGVTASLGNSAINTGDAAGDTYVNIENLYGTTFIDTLYGDANNNRIDGRGGDDTLFGGDGSDYMIGGAGDDVLNGESGNDLLLGQAGADIYQFDAAHGTDRIIVFTQGEDLIEFTEGVFDFSGLTFTQDGAHVNIVSSEGTIIVNNSLVADFASDDFIFATPPSNEPLSSSAGQELLDMNAADMAMYVEVEALI